MLCICNVPFAETGGSFCLSSYSIVCLDVASHVYELMLRLLLGGGEVSMSGYLLHINSCWCLTPLVGRVTRVDQRWTACRLLDRIVFTTVMNPKAPHVHDTIKLHKSDKPIRPIVNWKGSPGYKLAMHLAKLLKYTIQLPNVFNMQNSETVM
jgi:hypothetical protein